MYLPLYLLELMHLMIKLEPLSSLQSLSINYYLYWAYFCSLYIDHILLDSDQSGLKFIFQKTN